MLSHAVDKMNSTFGLGVYESKVWIRMLAMGRRCGVAANGLEGQPIPEELALPALG